jgi:lipopolysaccharide export system protein LptA
MKPFFPISLLVAALTLFAGGVHAEKADSKSPMNVEADALRYDELKQLSVFTGRVVLTKGSIIIRGGRIDVRQDADGNQYGLVTAEPGKLAFFRQKREGLDEFMEGEGETIEYDSRADTVKFIKQAQLRRYRGATLSDELSGGVIVYNNTTEVFTVDGALASPRPGIPAGRVRAMLTPQPESAAPSAKAATPAGNVPALRSSTTLGGEKK